MSEREAEKLIFLQYAAVFEGHLSQIRNKKPIKKLVREHQASAATVLKRYGKDSVITTLQSLLNRGVFDSQAQARIEFPELFSVSVQRAQQRADSQAEVAKSEADLLNDIASQEDLTKANCVPEVDKTDAKISNEPQSRRAVTVSTSTDLQGERQPLSALDTPATAPSLYPLYIPYQAQHQTLAVVQQQLEESCYDFTKRWFPDLLKDQGWDCPEAVELNKWTSVILKQFERLPQHCFNQDMGNSVKTILLAINHLRHTAVHRVHRSIDGLQELLQVSLSFCDTLQDRPRGELIRRLLEELGYKAKALAMNKNYLEQRVEAELQEVARARAELLIREQKAMAYAQEEDLASSERIGALFAQAARSIFAKERSEIHGEVFSSSEDYFEDATQGFEHGRF